MGIKTRKGFAKTHNAANIEAILQTIEQQRTMTDKKIEDNLGVVYMIDDGSEVEITLLHPRHWKISGKV